jgi:hypothetical protein
MKRAPSLAICRRFTPRLVFLLASVAAAPLLGGACDSNTSGTSECADDGDCAPTRVCDRADFHTTVKTCLSIGSCKSDADCDDGAFCAQRPTSSDGTPGKRGCIACDFDVPPMWAEACGL